MTDQLSSEILLENMSDAVLIVDAGLVVSLANGKATALLRRSSRELLGRPLLSLFPELQNTASERLIDSARRLSIPSRFELFIPSLFSWLSILAVPQEGSVVLFCRDITDRARREQDEAVRASVRRIVENLPLCVTITRGREHRIELANERARTLVGGRAVEGELLERVLPETREQGLIAVLDGVYATGTRYEAEERLFAWRPTPAEPERRAYFNLVYQPILDVSGAVAGVLHLGIDVTELIARRDTIAAYAAEREAVLQQLVEGVIITDGLGAISFVNAAAKRLHGVAVLNVKPDGYTQTYNLLTEDGQPHPPEELPLSKAVRLNQEVLAARWRIRRPDGTVVLVEGSAKPVFATGGHRIACVLTMHLLSELAPDVPSPP